MMPAFWEWSKDQLSLYMTAWKHDANVRRNYFCDKFGTHHIGDERTDSYIQELLAFVCFFFSFVFRNYAA